MADLRGLFLPAGTWWVAFWVGAACFAVTLVTLGGAVTPEAVLVVGAMVLACAVASAWGQALAGARLRAPVALPLLAALPLAWTAAALATGALVPELGGAVFVLAFLSPFFAVPGFLSLRTSSAQSLALVAPLVWFVGAIIVVARGTDGMERWQEGVRHAVWTSASVPILAMAVATSLAWLWARERRRVATWVAAGTADARVQRVTRRGAPQLASGVGAALLALLFTLGLTIGTGLLAPYLWQTGPAEEAPVGEAPSTEPAEPAPPSSGCNTGSDEADAVLQDARRDVTDALVQTTRSLLLVAFLLALAVLSVGVFGLPTRRLLLVRRLVAPPWSRSPSERVRDAWMLARIALDDLGVGRRPGESASAHAARAVATLPDVIELGPLSRCAALADRGDYAFGVAPDAPDRALRDAEIAYEAVWGAMGEVAKLRALYRWI